MKKRDMQEIEHEYQKNSMVWGDHDLAEFDKEITPYMIKKTFSDARIVTIPDERRFMIDHNAMNERGEIIMKGLRQLSDGSWDCKPVMFEIISSKLEQWRMWKGRKEYADKMRMMELAKLAEETAGKLSTSASMDIRQEAE